MTLPATSPRPPLRDLPDQHEHSDSGAFIGATLSRMACVGLFATLPTVLFFPSTTSAAYCAAAAVAHLAAFLLGGALAGDPFAPGRAVLHVFVVIWFGLAPMASISTGTFPGGAVYSDQTIMEVLAVVLVGLLAFEIGHLAAPTQLATFTPQEGPATWRTVLLLLMSIAAWNRLGGLDLTFASRTEAASSLAAIDGIDRGNLNRAGSSVLVAISRVPPAFLLVSHLLRSDLVNPLPRRLWTLSLIAINLLVSSPLSTPRQWVGGVAIAALMAAFTSQRSRRIIVAGLVPALLLAFPLANVFRSEVTADSNLRIDSPETALSERFDFDVFATTADALTKVEASGHTLGTQIMGPPLFWVPRAIWEDKPVYSGLIIFEESPTNESPHDNMSVSLWAEGYLDFGIAGVALLLFGYGWSIKRAESWLQQATPDWRTARSLLLIGFSLVVIRGPLLPIASTVTAVLFVSWFAGHRFPRRVEAA